MSVDLPAPFSPSSAWISPARRTKSTPSSARTPGNTFSTPRASSSGLSDVRIGSLDEPLLPHTGGKISGAARTVAGFESFPVRLRGNRDDENGAWSQDHDLRTAAGPPQFRLLGHRRPCYTCVSTRN